MTPLDLLMGPLDFLIGPLGLLMCPLDLLMGPLDLLISPLGLLMRLLDLPDSSLEEIFLGLLMLLEGIFKSFHVVVYFLSELIQVVQLRLLGFHQSMSLMRNQGQLLFDLEYPIHYLVLVINCLSFLYFRDRLQFLRHSLPDAGLNRAKLQPVKGFSVLLGEANERLGSCYLNAALIFHEDSFFREALDCSAFL
jgi:hypothetical protein